MTIQGLAMVVVGEGVVMGVVKANTVLPLYRFNLIQHCAVQTNLHQRGYWTDCPGTGLFTGLSVLACVLCGLVIGLGLYWLNIAPFMPTAMVIALTDALWAIVLGSVVLAFTYDSVSARRMLYTDILNKKPAKPADATLKT